MSIDEQLRHVSLRWLYGVAVSKFDYGVKLNYGVVVDQIKPCPNSQIVPSS